MRSKLAWLLAALALTPLLVAAAALRLLLPAALDGQAQDRLDAARAAVALGTADACMRLGQLARTTGLQVAASHSVQRALQAAAANNGASYTAVLGQGGTVIGSTGRLPGGVRPGGLASCATSDHPPRGAPGLIAQHVPLRIGTRPQVRSVVVALVVSHEASVLKRRLALSGQVVLASDDAVASTSAQAGQTLALLRLARANSFGDGKATAGWLASVQQPGPGQPYLLIVAEKRPGLSGAGGWLAIVVLLVALVSALVGWLLARRLSRPLEHLTEAAERAAAGNLDAEIGTDEDADKEVQRLSRSFHHMTEELRAYVDELRVSRDELRANVERLGEALSSTHNLEGILSIVLESAASATGAQAGLVAFEQPGGRIELVAEQGLSELGIPAPHEVLPGEGILGQVVSSGAPLRGPIGDGTLPEPAENEPRRGDVLAVPLRRSGQVAGVLALFQRSGGHSFDAETEEVVRTLAGQADVAVDNVMVHREVQRLSITDPLTGTWNFRYLSMSLNREIERASRFERPLAAVMLDLDHFKAVNDTYGHQRGDAVLRELAHRVTEQIREVDTLARYGGEEFVLVLPETGATGVGQVAERICEAVRRKPFGEPGEEPLTITVSIGAAVFDHAGGTAATLLRTADEALYRAKRSGRDRWMLAGTPERVG